MAVRFNDFQPCHKCGQPTHWAIWSERWKKFYRFCHWHIRGTAESKEERDERLDEAARWEAEGHLCRRRRRS